MIWELFNVSLPQTLPLKEEGNNSTALGQLVYKHAQNTLRILSTISDNLGREYYLYMRPEENTILMPISYLSTSTIDRQTDR